ncbi:MAG: hypothetical protein IPJ74_15175 [Saprospiraceae bacterium]|nr:hypothetical protein [Saprospiraceae bacterium]
MIAVNPFRETTQLKPFFEYINNGALDAIPLGQASSNSSEQNLFVEEGGLWTMAFAGKQVQLPDLKDFMVLPDCLQRLIKRFIAPN